MNRFSTLFFFALLFSFNNVFSQTLSKDALWLAPACKPKLFGLQDNKGGIAVKAAYDYLYEGDETGWIAYSQGKFGVINSSGNWIIKANFENIIQFLNGKAVAGKTSRTKIGQKLYYESFRDDEHDSTVYYGVIDASGVWVIDPTYDFLLLCDDGSVQFTDANGKFGFLNPDGTVMLKAQYEYASRMVGGLAIIGEPIKNENIYFDYSRRSRFKAGKYFIIDRTGNKLNAEAYDLIREFSDGRAAFNKGGIWKQKRYNESVRLIGGKWGFLDANGKEIIQASYDYVYDYSNGKAKVRIGQRVFWIDKDGKECPPPLGKSTKEFTIFCDPGFYGYIDLKGKWIIEPQFIAAKEFSEGLAAVMTLRSSDLDCDNDDGSDYGDDNYSSHRFRRPLSYLFSIDDYEIDYGDQEKFLVDSTRAADSIKALSARRLYGYIDASGNMILPAKYDIALPFQNGRAYVCFRDKWGVIDRKGNWIFAPVLEWPDEISFLRFSNVNYFGRPGDYSSRLQYEFLRKQEKEDRVEVALTSVENSSSRKVFSESKSVYSFSEGMGAIMKYGKFGFIDTTGKVIAAPVYDEVLPFSNGFAAVRHGKFWGYIDKTGKEIISLQYKSAASFSKEGLACVGTIPSQKEVIQEVSNDAHPSMDYEYESDYNVYYGYIDKKGNWTIKPQFTKAGNFSDGLAPVSKDYQKQGYIDKTGKYVIPPKYDYAYEYEFGFALVKINMLEPVYIDKTGKVSKIFNSNNVPFDKTVPLRKDFSSIYRYGFVNEKGEKIIPHEYSNAGNFSRVK